MKLTTAVRCAFVFVALAVTALVGVGCASNASHDWAQNSPVIAPSASGQPIVSLGAVERGS